MGGSVVGAMCLVAALTFAGCLQGAPSGTSDCGAAALKAPSGTAKPIPIQKDPQGLAALVLEWAGDGVNTTQVLGTGWTARTALEGTLSLALDADGGVSYLRYSRPGLPAPFTQPALQSTLADLAQRLQVPGEYSVGGATVGASGGATSSSSPYPSSSSSSVYYDPGLVVRITQMVDGVPVLPDSGFASLTFSGPAKPAMTLSLPVIYAVAGLRLLDAAAVEAVAALAVRCEVASHIAPVGLAGPGPVDNSSAPHLVVMRGALAYPVRIGLLPSTCPPAYLDVVVDAVNGALLQHGGYVWRASCNPPPPQPPPPPPPPPPPLPKPMPKATSLKPVLHVTPRNGVEDSPWLWAGSDASLDGHLSEPYSAVVNASVVVRQSGLATTYDLHPSGEWRTVTVSFPEAGLASLTFTVRDRNGTSASVERTLEVDEEGYLQHTFQAGDVAGVQHADDCAPPPGGDSLYHVVWLPVAGHAGILEAQVTAGSARIAICSDTGPLTHQSTLKVDVHDVSSRLHPYLAVVSAAASNDVTVRWFVGYGETSPYPTA